MHIQKPLVHIPKPCPASWQEMTPNSTGRLCTSCDKTVVDFTAMSDEEIKFFFLAKKEEKVCGHFLSSQVTTTYTPWQQQLIQTHAYVDRKLSFPFLKSAVLLVITAVMLLSGCATKPTGKPTIDGTPVELQSEVEMNITGDTTYFVPEDTMQKK